MADADQTASPLPVCPVCEANSWSAPGHGTRLRRCGECGTILNDRSATREQEEDLYRQASSGVATDASGVAEAQWRWLMDLLPPRRGGSQTRPQPGESGTPALAVLDIGCGYGAFLIAAREAGCRVAGVEIDPAAVAAAREAGLQITEGSLFDSGLPAGPWDVITFWDVLDHLEDPREALRLATDALAPGGLLLARGRNAKMHASVKAWYARLRPLAAAMRLPDLSTVHRWGFAPGGWVRLLQSAGLEEVRLQPGMPTPGDRYGTLGPQEFGFGLKALLRGIGTGVHLGSGKLVYPFPTALVSGRRPATDEG